MIRELRNERISWVKPGNYHVTIRFLGDTPTKEVSSVKNALGGITSLPTSKNLQLQSIGSFGPRKRPRVIWSGFQDPGIFTELREMTDRALVSCGYKFNTDPLKAHLTLGRIRSLKDILHFYEVLERMKDLFRGEVLVDRMIFYRSRLRKEGPVYESLLELPFNSSGAPG